MRRRLSSYRTLGPWCAAFLAATCAATSAAADEAGPPPAPGPARAGDYTHDGFYARFSVGFAYVHAIGASPEGVPSYGGPGLANSIAVGGTLGHGLVVAATAGIATGSDSLPPSAHPIAGSISVTSTLYGVLVDWFLVPTRGAHFGGALGLSRMTLAGISDFTAALSIHGGYDFWMTSNWSAGILAAVMTAPLVRADFGEGPISWQYGYVAPRVHALRDVAVSLTGTTTRIVGIAPGTGQGLAVRS